jgi:biotin carboxyl carrier protein
VSVGDTAQGPVLCIIAMKLMNEIDLIRREITSIYIENGRPCNGERLIAIKPSN